MAACGAEGRVAVPELAVLRYMPSAPHLPVVQEDDQDIQEEGLDSLTEDELRQACRWGLWWGGSWPAHADPGQLASAGWQVACWRPAPCCSAPFALTQTARGPLTLHRYRARGMRAPFGEGSSDFMRQQLTEWIDWSLNK